MTEEIEKKEQNDNRTKVWNKYVKKQKRLRRWTIFLMVLLLAVVGVGIAGLGIVNKMLESTPELDTKELISEESTKIFDGKGNLLTEIGTYYRENTTYDKFPESLVDAFLAIEDSRYFEHNGFDIPRFTKAVIDNLRSNMESGGGGSTFTMQLVKNSFFSVEDGSEQTERERSYEYKIQQIFLSMQLEQVMDKKQIFELYLNKLNFGGQIRGVKKAAEYYFGKDITQLNLSESALLAGIINLPNKYNPYDYLDYATDRRNDVLYMMNMHGYINDDEYYLAKSIKVEDQLVGEDILTVESREYPAYIDAVIEEAIELTNADPVIKGMRIYTALDPTIQERVEDIEAGEYVTWPDELFQVSMVVLNNHNGEIVAIGGGRNYGESGARNLNRATKQFKQPGSSIKPVLEYALAFEYLGYSLDEILLDKPITFPGESRVLVNATGKYVGDITLKDAVASSLNIPAILTLEAVTSRIGSEAVVQYLHDMGISRASNDTYHMSYAIGGNALETTVKEMAGAHGAMINGGVYNQPHTIRKIEASTGEEYTTPNQDKQIISPGSAWLVTQLMENNVTTNIYNYMQVLRRNYPVYAKTGTTDWGSDGLQYGIPKGVAKDKWMIASTSQYTNAVWVGYDKAEKDKGTYYHPWKSQMNIPGRVNVALLDIEEEVSPDTLDGVERPNDVQDVTYVYGTYPHVAPESWMGSSRLKTSQISTAGIKNQPLVSANEYTEGRQTLTSISASCSNGLLYISWNSQNGCSGGSRDISLHDPWNNIDQKGKCLVDTSWLFKNSDNTYVAEVYANQTYITTVTSKTSSYAGLPAQITGNISVCGYYYNSKGNSDKVCTDAGTYIPKIDKPAEDEEKEEAPASSEESSEEEE